MGYLLIGNLKDAVGGVEVAELKQLWMLEEPDSPLRIGDVIVHLDGRPTPNMKAFQVLAKRDEFAWQVPFVNPGDPIRMAFDAEEKTQ